MKILQLASDWKWTGPAEPMLVLMSALRERGHHVDLVCPEPPPSANRSLWQEAARRDLAPIHSIDARRSAVRPGDGSRARRLGHWLATDALAGPYDIVHCWHSRDHVLAARALGLGWPFARRPRRTRVVRFLGHAEPMRSWPWSRWLFGVGCDGLVCVSDRAAMGMRALRGGRPMASTMGAVDLDRLEPRRGRREVRAALGLDEDAIAIAVIARMQSHRRFDLLLEALARTVPLHPKVRLVVFGRGSRVDEVVREPAERLGVGAYVVLAGYRVDDYVDCIAAMDLCTFLVPGSDGTCRALLEAAALGLPLVGSRRGAIPEIVSNGRTGLIVNDEASSLAHAWRGLIEDGERRRQMGRAARREARARFHPDRHAAWMERFYEEVWAHPEADIASAQAACGS